MEQWFTPKIEDLFQTILCLRNMNEAKKFFRDLLTDKELVELSNRWRAARMLDEGMPYVQIERDTGLSSTTIARISKWMKEGVGGYQLMLKRTTDQIQLRPAMMYTKKVKKKLK